MTSLGDILYVHQFLSSLVFTMAVETAVLFFMLIFVFRDRSRSWADMLFAGVFAQFATVSYVWFVFPYITDWSRAASLWASEPFVFLVEALFYRMYLRLDIRTALAISLVCNAASYFLGPLLRAHGIWIYW